MDEAQRIANVSKRTGIPVIVGTMHTYDPAYLAAHRSWMTSGATATLVRSVIYLPPNEAFVEVATDLVGAPAPSRPPDLARPGAQTARLRGAVLGLAIHTIPLVRRLIPTIDAVRVAKLLQPFGYVLTLTSGARSAQLVGLMPGQWRADWTFQAWAAGHELRVQFPPSYVLAGSATAEYATPTSRSVWHFPQNGYQVEWLHVANIAQGYEVPSVSLDEAVEDLHFALQVADGAGARLQE